MSTPSTTAEPQPADPQHAEQQPDWSAQARSYAAVVDGLILSGTKVVASLEQAICAPAAPLAPADKARLAIAHDRAILGVRRSILLAEKLANPPPPRAQRVTEARGRVLREVEDTIQREAGGDRAQLLGAELVERVEMPEFAEQLENRPIEDLIRDIRRDLGLTAPPGTRPWKRRRPQDIALLHARASQRPPILSSA